MRIHLIKKQSIEGYVLKNARSRSSFEIWLSIIRHADWNEPGDIISTFNSADILGKGSDRVVFNIGGNNYRLIGKYHFGTAHVLYSSNGLALTRSIQNSAMKGSNMTLITID